MINKSTILLFPIIPPTIRQNILDRIQHNNQPKKIAIFPRLFEALNHLLRNTTQRYIRIEYAYDGKEYCDLIFIREKSTV
jgi:hypothetical protein